MVWGQRTRRQVLDKAYFDFSYIFPVIKNKSFNNNNSNNNNNNNNNNNRHL